MRAASGRRRVTGGRIDREASVGATRTTPFLFSGLKDRTSDTGIEIGANRIGAAAILMSDF